MTGTQRPKLRWRALWRLWALMLGVGVVATCDTLSPSDPSQANIVVKYMGDTILKVGDTVRAPVNVSRDGSPVTLPRLRFIPPTNDNTIKSVGDTALVATTRGTVTVIVQLVGSTLGDSPPADTIRIHAVAASVKIDKPTLGIHSLNDSVQLVAQALSTEDSIIAGTTFTWVSSDTSVIGVTSTGVTLPKKNGTATILAVVDNDTASSAVTVSQILAHYTFQSRTNPAPVKTVTLDALGDTLTVVAVPHDSGGSVILTGAPAPTWASAATTAVAVTAGGQVTSKQDNTTTAIVATGGLATDTVDVSVNQVATQVRIVGPHVLGIPAINHTDTLNTIATDRLGATLTTRTANLRADEVVVHVVDPKGVTRTLATGNAYVFASLDNGKDSVLYQVTNNPVSLSFISNGLPLPNGLQFQSLNQPFSNPVVALPLNATGGAVALTPTDVVTWASANPLVATVVPVVGQLGQATVTSVGAGNTILTATLNGTIVGSLAVSVTNSPAHIDIIPTAKILASVGDTAFPQVNITNSVGQPLTRTSVTWTSDDPTIATVAADGTITAVNGSATSIFVHAFSPVDPSGTRDSILITVTNAPAAVQLNLHSATLTSLTKTQTFTAQVTNSKGNAITGSGVIVWSSTNAAVATVDVNGVATAVAVGTAKIVATAGTKADTATLTVQNNPTQMVVTPLSVSLNAVGQTQQLTTTVKNDLGNPIAGLVLAYGTSDPTVATVSAAGLVTAVSPGSATVTISTPGNVLQTTVGVAVANPPTIVVITSADTTLTSIGATYSPGVNFKNAQGAVLPRNAVVWTSSNTAIATVTNAGVVAAVAVGVDTVFATSPANANVQDSVIVTVQNVSATLTVAPAGPVTLSAIGATVNLVATVKNGLGAVIGSPNPVVSWSSNNGSVTVNASGVATAAASGSATITATSGSATANVTVNVTLAASAAHSTVSAGAASLTANGAATTTITVQLKDSLGVNLGTSGGTVTMTLGGSGTLSGVTDVGNGTYTATLTAPTAIGTGTISATINGAGISSTALVTYVAAAATKYLVTSSTFTPTAGTTVTISAQLADANSNPVSIAGKTVTWSSTAGGSFGAPTSLTNAQGLATVSFTTSTTAPTHHQVTATDNTAVSGTSSDILTISGGAASYLVTPGTTNPVAGASVQVNAQLVDGSGNAISLPGQTVTWTKSNGNGSFSPSNTSTTNASGVATVTFVSHTVTGTATTITATTGGTTGTSATITTVSGAMSAATSTIGTSGGSFAAGGAGVTITVTGKDANGNLLASSGGAAVALHTTLGALTQAIDQGNGTFTATLTGTQIGSATVSATVNLVAITTGNVSVTITPAAAAAAASVATVPAGTAGSATSVTVQAKDQFGNNVTTGGATLVATVTGTNSATPAVNDVGNGTYTFSYTPALAGTDQIAITLGGSAISGSPYTSAVSSGTVATFLVETQGGGAIGTQVASVPFSVRVSARDASGNLVTTFAGTVDLTSTGALTGSPLTSAALTNGVLASQAVTITNTGSFTITATKTVGGSPSTASNTFSVVAGAAVAAQSTGSVPATGTAGSVTTITVQAKDANGNNRTSTSGTLVVSVTGANTATASVVDHLDGTYTATYTPVASGTDNVAITLGGGAISGSPFSSVVSPAVLDHFAVTNPSGNPIASQTAGTSFAVKLVAQDGNNNTVTGFASTAVLTSTGALTGAPLTTAGFVNGVLASQAVTITNTGSVTLTATAGGKTGTSNAFSVTPGAAAAAQTTATVPAGAVGSLTSITVQAKDAHGNNATAGGATVVVNVSGANTAAPAVTDNGNGTYSASYTPTVTGTDNVAITLGGSAINGSPYSSAVSSGVVANFLVEAAGGGAIGTQTAGSSFNVKITARDASNNTVTAFTGAGNTVTLTSNGILTGAPLTSATFTNGVLASQAVTITSTGAVTLTATKTAATASGISASFTVNPGAASAAQSTAAVPAGTAGGLTTITLQAKDAFGNNRTSTSGVAAGSVTGANAGATVNAVDNANGTYTLTYTPSVTGSDAIAITLGGTPIGGSPYASVVSTGVVNSFLVEAAGGGAIGAQTAGTSFNLRITARDAGGNLVTSFNGGTNTVTLTSSGTLTGAPITTAAFTNGVLASQAVTITNTGSFTITATKTVGGSPSTASGSFLVGAGAAVAAQSTGSVPATGTAGSVTTITVQAKDANGNNRTSTSGTLVVSVTGANTATASVVDHLDGTYTATYTPVASGTDNVAITLGGGAISGSPFSSVVSPAVLDHFAVTNPSGNPIASQTAGTSFPVKLVAQDGNNNTVTGFASTAVLTSTGALTGAPLTTAGFVNGVLASQAVTITNTGSVTLTATAGGKTGTSNTFTVLAGAAAAAQTTATVPPGTAGAVTTITVQAKDANSNNVTVGGATVVVNVTGANTAAPAVTDNGNGTYSASYTPTVTGTDNVAITLGGSAINGSPYSSVVSAGAVSNFLVEAAGGGAIPTQTAGSSFNIKVTARDANNNTVTGFTGAGNTVALTSSGTLTGAPLTSAAFTNGVLASQAVAITSTGAVTITATKSAGTQVGVSTSFTVNPAAASATQSTASVPAGTAGALTTITLQAKDAFGNNRSSTSGVAAGSVSGANAGATVNAVDNANGTYTLTYTPSVAGTDAVAITLGGTAIGGSPYSSVVSTGVVNSFLVEAAGGGAIPTEAAGTSFAVRITARDASNNTVTSFNGGTNTVTLTSNGTLTGAPITTAAFTNGVLTSQAVTITNTGSFTITATKTVGGSPATASNTFIVNAAAATQLAILTQPSATATAGSAIATQPVLQIRDAAGNVVTTDNTTVVTATAIGGTGTLQGTTTATAASGVATFANLSYNVAEGITVRFTTTSPVLTQATSNGITVNAAAASAISVTQSPTASPQSGVAFPTQPTIQLRDAFNNAVATSGVHVVASITAGGGTLGGTTDVTTDGTGLATFTNLSITGTAGARTITYTVSAPFSATTTSGVTLTAGTATNITVTTAPTASPQNAIAFPVQPVIQVRDAQGNPVLTSGTHVVASITAGGGALSGTTDVTTDASGVATFTNLAITGTVGPRTITYTVSAPFSATTTSSVTLVAGAATQLTIGTQPSASATAGVALAQQPVLNVKDVSGNVVLTDNTTQVTAVPSAGVLSGTVTATAVAGVATFANLGRNLAGTFTLTFTASGLTTAGPSSTVTINPAAAAALAIATQPSATGTPNVALAQQPVVNVVDAFGNIRTGDNTTVVTAVPSSGSLTNATATAVSGVATFSGLTQAAAGTFHITFTVTSLTSGVSSDVVATASTATNITVTTAPTASPQNAIAFPAQPVIQVRDAQGNPVLASGTHVVASITAGGGTLNGTTDVTTDANGTATYTNLSITGTVGPRTITYTVSAPFSATTTSNVTLVAGAATQLVIATQPSASATAGVALATQPAGNVEDVSGNVVLTDNTTQVTAVPSAGTLNGTVTATAVAGVATFANLGRNLAGTFTLTFTASGLTTAGPSSTVTINPAAAAALAVQTQPSTTATPNVALAQQPVVNVVDAFGNIRTGDNTTVVTAVASSGSLTNATATAAAGVATFVGLAQTTAGSFHLTFTATSLAPATSTDVVATAGTATQIVVTTAPTASPQNAIAFPTQPVIQVRDAQGNPVLTAGTHVVASITAGGGTLGGTTDVTTDVNGAATFTDLKITGTVGLRTITYTVSAPFSATTTSNVTLVAGAATQLLIATQPSASATAGVALATEPAVNVEDVSGNVVLTDNTTQVTAVPSAGTLNGTVTATAVAGVATFTNLGRNLGGTFTLTFTASGLTTSAASNSITINPAAAAALAVQTQPSTTATPNVALAQQPVVNVVDAFGNIRTGDNTTIVTAVASSGSLTNATATAAAGVATFVGLTQTAAGTFHLTFTASGLSSTVSNDVNAAAGTATNITVTTAPTASPQNAIAFPTQPVIQVRDAQGNPVLTAGTHVVASITAGGGTLNGTTDVTTDANGVATYSNLSITGTVGPRTITYTVNSPFSATTTSSVTLVAGAATQLAINTQASASTTAGTALAQQPVIEVRDVSGNVALTDNTTQITAVPSAGTLSGTVTATAVAGVATFTNLGRNLAGTFTLTFSASGLTSAGPSSSITINPAAAAALTIATEPAAAATAGVAFTTQPAVNVVDAFGNVRTGDNTTVVTAARLGGTGTLAGTLTATALSGVATFTNLAMNTAGTITIQFTSGALISAASTSIVVSASAAARIAVARPPTANPQSGVNFPVQPLIQVLDAQNNPVATSGVHVVASITAGGGTLGGTTDVTTDGSGLATFTDLSIAGTVGARTLTFTVSAPFSASTTANVNLVAGLINNFLVEAEGGGAIPAQTAGSAFNLRLTARDGADNVVTGFTGTADLTSTGTLSGGPTVVSGSFVAGVLASQPVTITNTGSFTITATNGSTGQSAAFSVVAGVVSATTTTISANPTSVTAGTPSTITVQAKDAAGNNRATSSGTVTLATDLGSLSAVIDNGDGTYTATLSTPTSGTAHVSGTIAGNSITSGNAAVTINVGTASAATTTITPGALSITADGASTTLITVQAKDAQGNNLTTGGATVTLTTTLGTLSSTASGTGTTVTADDIGGGVYRATLHAGTATGAATVSGTLNGPAITSGNASVTFAAGTATHYSVSRSSASITVGTPDTITAQLLDVHNNPVGTSGKTVTWTSNPGSPLSFATATSVTNSSGVATVVFTPTIAASYTVTATDNTALTGTSGTIADSPAALDHFDLVLASPQTDGVAFTGTNTLTAKDQFNNTIINFDASTDNVTIAANAPLTGAVSGLSGANKLTNAGDFTGGVANLTGSLTYIGNTNTGTFTATSGTGKVGTSGAVLVSAGAATHFVISGTGSQTAGTSQDITVTAKDVGNNTATGYTGDHSLTFSGANQAPDGLSSPTVTDKTATPIAFTNPTTITFASGVNTSTATMVLYAAETAHVVATDGGVTTTGGDRLTVVVSDAGLDNFLLSINPAAQTSGLAFTGVNTLTARDVYDNTVTGFDASGDNVTISATGGLTGGTISGLSGVDKLTSNLDFVNGVANLSAGANAITYTGPPVTTTGTLTATSVSIKTGTSGTVTIN